VSELNLLLGKAWTLKLNLIEVRKRILAGSKKQWSAASAEYITCERADEGHQKEIGQMGDVNTIFF